MSYTARSVAAAVAPWPLTIGRHTFTAWPVSAALVLRVLPEWGADATRADALVTLLRAAFPTPAQSWWHRCWYGRLDPVARILALPPHTQATIVERLLHVPGADDTAAEDPLQALIAAHRRLAHSSPKHGTGPSLALIALTCEMRLGASWYYAPRRWPTSDGYAPLAIVFAQYRGLQALAAQDRIDAATAVRLGNADWSKAQAAFARLTADAYPPDPTLKAGVH